MIKKVLIAFLLLLLCIVVHDCSLKTSDISPECIKIQSPCILLGAYSTGRDGGYSSWLFWSKDEFKFELECAETEDNNALLFNELKGQAFAIRDIMAGTVNQHIPIWKFYYRVSRKDIVFYSSFDFDVDDKKTHAQIDLIKTYSGHYLIVSEEGHP